MAYAHQDWINVLESFFFEILNIHSFSFIIYLFFILENRTETMLFSGSRDGLIKVWGVHENKLRCLNDLNHHTVIFI